MRDLEFLSLVQLAKGLRRKDYTCVELTQHYLARIARLDRKAHAFVSVYEESALRQAAAADQQRQGTLPLSPLHGLPIAVKDLCEIESRITTAGSAAWQNRRSRTTSAVVERLMSAGMIVLGKTHMVEFAFGAWGTNSHMGTPRNPWDWSGFHRAPGGSSSGSAVAVAAGLAPAAIASDTGGSARIPAAFNGLTGLKVSHGLISTQGVIPMAPSLDSMGTLSRSAEDAALLVDALANHDAHAQAGTSLYSALRSFGASSARGLRIAVMAPDQYPVAVTADVQAAVDAAIDIFRSLGASAGYCRIPVDFGELIQSQGILGAAEAYQIHAAYIEDDSLPFDPWVRKRILAGKATDAQTYREAQHRRRVLSAAFHQWMQSYDVLLTPTLPFAAPPLLAIDENAPITHFTRAVNYLGGCAISLPAGFAPGGLPVGIQLIARPWHESLLLSVAKVFQEETTWHLQTPPGLE